MNKAICITAMENPLFPACTIVCTLATPKDTSWATGDDGARHSGDRHGVLREGTAIKYAWMEQNKLRGTWLWRWICSAAGSWANRWREAVAAGLACRALDMAWYSWLPAAPGLIFQSDRGSQYVSGCYTDLLAGHGIPKPQGGEGRVQMAALVQRIESASTLHYLSAAQFEQQAIATRLPSQPDREGSTAT